jgi:hypothetical protein
MKTRTKVLITIALAVIWFKGCQSLKAAEVCLLEQKYAIFNQDYFLDQLPTKVNILWADMTNQDLKGDMGATWIDEAGVRQIRIDRKTNPVSRQAELTLLHEQCHIKVYGRELDMHGIKWQACMVDLAEHGAMHDLW